MPTKIPYCNEVLEVSGGCTKCETGCTHCWAIEEVWRMAHNPKLGDKWQGLVEKTASGLNWTGRIKLFEDVLTRRLPGKGKTYFIDSKSDLFHPKVKIGYIHQVFDFIRQYPQHTFQIFTKRIERAFNYSKYNGWRDLENVHLSVSISTQKEADEKIPLLLQIPAAVRFVSVEPMLERIDLSQLLDNYYTEQAGITAIGHCSFIDLVIIGVESINGRAGRYCSIDDVRFVVNQCKAAGVSVFVKQLHINGKLSREMAEWPQDLRVQEYPK